MFAGSAKSLTDTNIIGTVKSTLVPAMSWPTPWNGNFWGDVPPVSTSTQNDRCVVRYCGSLAASPLLIGTGSTIEGVTRVVRRTCLNGIPRWASTSPW